MKCDGGLLVLRVDGGGRVMLTHPLFSLPQKRVAPHPYESVSPYRAPGIGVGG